MAFLLAARPFFQEFKDKKSLMGGGGGKDRVSDSGLDNENNIFIVEYLRKNKTI